MPSAVVAADDKEVAASDKDADGPLGASGSQASPPPPGDAALEGEVRLLTPAPNAAEVRWQDSQDSPSRASGPTSPDHRQRPWTKDAAPQPAAVPFGSGSPRRPEDRAARAPPPGYYDADPWADWQPRNAGAALPYPTVRSKTPRNLPWSRASSGAGTPGPGSYDSNFRVSSRCHGSKAAHAWAVAPPRAPASAPPSRQSLAATPDGPALEVQVIPYGHGAGGEDGESDFDPAELLAQLRKERRQHRGLARHERTSSQMSSEGPVFFWVGSGEPPFTSHERAPVRVEMPMSAFASGTPRLAKTPDDEPGPGSYNNVSSQFETRRPRTDRLSARTAADRGFGSTAKRDVCPSVDPTGPELGPGAYGAADAHPGALRAPSRARRAVGFGITAERLAAKGPPASPGPGTYNAQRNVTLAARSLVTVCHGADVVFGGHSDRFPAAGARRAASGQRLGSAAEAQRQLKAMVCAALQPTAGGGEVKEGAPGPGDYDVGGPPRGIPRNPPLREGFLGAGSRFAPDRTQAPGPGDYEAAPILGGAPTPRGPDFGTSRAQRWPEPKPPPEPSGSLFVARVDARVLFQNRRNWDQLQQGSVVIDGC